MRPAKVSDAMTKWDQAHATNEPPKMSDEEIKKLTSISMETGKCMQAAMAVAAPAGSAGSAK